MTTVDVKLRLPEELLEYLERESQSRQISLDELVSEALADYFDEPSRVDLLAGLRQAMQDVLAGNVRSYAGTHRAMADKSQTYSVEGNNAELRHYLARLARALRCFSRSIEALWAAVRLFVYAWNARQLYKRQYPRYPTHVRDFVLV